jgi:hypothetical protein
MDESPFVITVTHGKETYSASGSTLEEALERLTVPPKIVAKTFIAVSHGERKLERMLLPAKAKQFFYPIARPFIAKKLGLLLK